jgi:hypothetical protein
MLGGGAMEPITTGYTRVRECCHKSQMVTGINFQVLHILFLILWDFCLKLFLVALFIKNRIYTFESRMKGWIFDTPLATIEEEKISSLRKDNETFLKP